MTVLKMDDWDKCFLAKAGRKSIAMKWNFKDRMFIYDTYGTWLEFNAEMTSIFKPLPVGVLLKIGEHIMCI